ncbi:glycosyltransferase [Candidatus Allofournierella merdavium]|uniref:glycosyltransferase n=1 Tax=Candidatus Allofournierella merdavium TaxID=2838593 RepID=UPI00374F3E28
MPTAPLVTVVITTYNQERYIRQAIDSVLAQKTDFDFEVYITEDCGTDGTRAILREYAARFPERIRLNLRDKNVGISRNWYEGLCAARGSFVCTLEGDDWWRDDRKLQKQADFLRAHPEYLAVSHTLLLTDDAGNTYGTLPDDERILNADATMALFLRGVTYSCTACMVRNIFQTPDPAREAYVTANRSIADFALCMLYLDGGRVFVMDDAMSAYRVSGGDPAHQNYNTRASAVKKYADFLDVVLASKGYFGRRYPFTRCLLAGTFYPLIDRVKYGGLGPFAKEMGRLPAAAKLALPFYFAGRCLRLVWGKFFGKKEAKA